MTWKEVVGYAALALGIGAGSVATDRLLVTPWLEGERNYEFADKDYGDLGEVEGVVVPRGRSNSEVYIRFREGRIERCVEDKQGITVDCEDLGAFDPFKEYRSE